MIFFVKHRFCLLGILLVSSVFSTRSEDDFDFDLSEYGIEPEIPAAEIKVAPLPEPKPSAEAPVGLPVTIPYLGTVTMYPYTEGEESGLKAQLPDTNKKLDLSILTIDDGELRTLEDKFSYTARASFLGKPVRIGFKDVTDLDKIPVGIFFTEAKPALELIPGARLELQSATMLLEKQKPLQIIAATTIAGQLIELVFTIDTKAQAADVKADLKNISFGSLIPQLKDTALADSKITSLSLRSVNLQTKDPTKKLQVILEGKADLSGVPGLGDAARESTLKGIFDASGISMEITIPALVMPGAGEVKDARLLVDFIGKNRTIVLKGTTTITLPSVGSFTAELNSQLSKEGIEFSGTVKDLVSYAGISLSSAQLTYSAKDRSLTLMGDAEISGQKVKIGIKKDAQNNVSVEGSVVEGKSLKPFDMLHIPVISDISLLPTKLKIAKTATGTEIATTGEVEFLGMPLTGDLSHKKIGTSDVTLLVLKAQPGFKLVEGISFNNLFFVLSSADFKGEAPDEFGKAVEVDYKKGINFVAETTLRGVLTPVALLTGSSPDAPLTVTGSWNPSAAGGAEVRFTADLPATLNLQFAQVGKLKLEFSLEGTALPSISLLTNVTTSSGGDRLEFVVRIALAPLKASLSGSMNGIWNKPFGISGLQIGNLAIQADFPLPPLPVPPLPSVIGSLCIGGEMAQGDTRCLRAQRSPDLGPLCKGGFGACMAIKFPDVLSAEMEKLTLGDIIAIAVNMVGKKLDASSMPEIGLKDVKIYIVPNETSIGEFKFEKGFNVTGKTDLLGVHAEMGISVIPDILHGGIKVQGSLERINFQNVLKITGKDGKSKAQIDGEVTLKRVGLLIDGELNLANLYKTSTQVEISKNGFMFDFESSFGKDTYRDPDTGKEQPLLLSHVHGQSSGSLNNPQFEISIIFKQYLKKYITEQVLDGLRAAEKAVTEGFNAAKAEIDKVNNAVDTVNKKMREAQDQLDRATAALESIQKARREARDKLDGAQRDVDSIRNEITSLDNWYKGLPDVC